MSKFENFLGLVQDAARKEGKAFFLDCGEGRSFCLGDLEGEDLSGWLIPLSDAEEFFLRFHAKEGVDQWLDCMVFARWNETEGGIGIQFETY